MRYFPVQQKKMDWGCTNTAWLAACNELLMTSSFPFLLNTNTFLTLLNCLIFITLWFTTLLVNLFSEAVRPHTDSDGLLFCVRNSRCKQATSKNDTHGSTSGKNKANTPLFIGCQHKYRRVLLDFAGELLYLYRHLGKYRKALAFVLASEIW